jgi:hypothetical protein
VDSCFRVVCVDVGVHIIDETVQCGVSAAKRRRDGELLIVLDEMMSGMCLSRNNWKEERNGVGLVENLAGGHGQA